MTARQKRRLQRKLARRADLQNQPNQGPDACHTNAHVANTPAADACNENSKEAQEAPIAAISEAKHGANRANAQLSTGPTTTSGKQIASQNSTRHGLTGTFRVLPDESQP